MKPMFFLNVSVSRGGKGILISDGFCPTLTGQILYVMTDITKEKDVTDEEYMCTDRHETVD